MTDQEYIDFLRFWLGDITESTITDANLLIILGMVQTQYPTATECQIKYYFIKAVLEWLLREEAKGASGSAGGGAGTYQKKIEEQIGKRKKIIEWGIDTSGATASVATGWQKVLDDLIENPKSLGCDPFPSTGGSSSSGSVVIGGGDMYSDPYTSKRKRDEATYNSRCTNPWRPRR